MARKKVGDLIKEARTNAGLTQEQLAKKVDNTTASDISKAERGEKALTQAALKQIAKATGVTQKSLLEAASGATTAAKKTTTAAKTTSAAKKTSTAKKTTTARKTTSSSTSVKLTAAEKKLLDLYRAANAEARKAAEAALKGEQDDEDGGIVETLLGGAMNLLNTIGK